MTTLHALLIAASLAQAAGDEPAKGAAAERLAFMQARLKEYAIRPSGGEKPGEPLAFREEPLLRWSNPVSGMVDGGVFLWERNGRPMAIDKVYLNRDRLAWGEALQSLAPGPLEATRRGQVVWSPAGPGLAFTTVKDVSPAERPAGRLVQMRAIARRFAMSGSWGEVPQPWELRLLPEPIHRYAAPADGIADGGLFVFTQGTNPEGLVVIEAAEEGGKTVWRYAVSRLTKYGIDPNYAGTALPALPRLTEFPPHQIFRHDWHLLARWPFAEEEP